MSPPHTIWRKFTPMVPPIPPNPGYATAQQKLYAIRHLDKSE